MPEQPEQAMKKQTEEKTLSEIEREGEVQIEKIPSQEISEMREAILEEISQAEKPQKKIIKKIIPKKKKQSVEREVPPVKSEIYKNIESIMEEDLVDVYVNMTPEIQKKFKEEGEKTAFRIEKLLQKTKVKIKEIIKLIRGWLMIIPGVNKYFMEQEAKIKTDKILRIKK